jgi:hypothetical protein
VDKYFYCYSYPLKEFLLSNEQKSIVVGRHPKTNKKYWVFEGTEQLNNLLTEWKLRKN